MSNLKNACITSTQHLKYECLYAFVMVCVVHEETRLTSDKPIQWTKKVLFICTKVSYTIDMRTHNVPATYPQRIRKPKNARRQRQLWLNASLTQSRHLVLLRTTFSQLLYLFSADLMRRGRCRPPAATTARDGTGRVGNNSTEHVGLLEQGTARGAERSRTPIELRHLRSTVGFADLVKVLLTAYRRRKGRFRRQCDRGCSGGRWGRQDYPVVTP